MRALIQRVAWARVTVGGETTGEIGPGLCVFVGVTHTDSEAAADKLAGRLWTLRIFDDEGGFMNRPVSEAGGEILVVSQFTLYADLRGRRPGFSRAASPDRAEPLVERVSELLSQRGFTVASGRFGAMMDVELTNQGPVTFVLSTDPWG